MNQEWLTEEQMLSYVSEAEQILLGRIPEEDQLVHSFSRRFRKKMNALLRYERRSVPVRKLITCTRNVAAAILLVLGTTLAVAMSVEAYREIMWSYYNGLVGNIDVNKIKTDALEERLEEQIRGFDGVDAAEVKMNADGSVLIKLKVQPGFRSEEQIKEYIQAFVSCAPESILLDIEK